MFFSNELILESLELQCQLQSVNMTGIDTFQLFGKTLCRLMKRLIFSGYTKLRIDSFYKIFL